MAADPHRLRVFLEGIVTGNCRELPAEFRGLARAVLDRRASPAEVDDLLGEFLLRLVDASRRDRAGTAAALLKLDDAAIRASIRHRLRQVLAETCAGARLRKQLRAMVKVVLKQELPPAPACAPTSLYRGDRLSTALVREAVAWVLAQEDRPPRSTVAIAGRLQSLYFGGDRPPEPEPVQASFEEQLLGRLDAPQLVLDLQRHLGADLARVTALRAGGAELKTIAADRQVAVSTAHQRVTTAVQRLRRVARRRRLGPNTLEPLLTALAP